MSLSLFWGFGYFLFTAISGRGDWAFLISFTSLERTVWLRVVMGLGGALLYYAAMKLALPFLPRGRALLLCYLMVGAVACLAASFYIQGPRLPALREAALEGFGVGFGWLLIALADLRRGDAFSLEVGFRTGWITAFVVIAAVFFATMGRGLVWSG